MSNLNDKYKMRKEQNRRYARQNFTNLVHTNARFEGINTTLPQTQTIIDGLGVDGVSINDINTIVDIKKGWELITTSNEPLDLAFMQKINSVVADKDSLAPGEFRTGQGMVIIGSDQEYVPPIVNLEQEKEYFTNLMKKDISTTERALKLMYHNMRSQLFWDGNKRTATLAANKLMIDNGAGLINIPLNKWGHWNELISDYYRTDNSDKILDWTYKNGIQGIDIGNNQAGYKYLKHQSSERQ